MRGHARNLVLPFGKPAAPPVAQRPAPQAARRLWLCLQLPQLPLEVVAPSGGSPRAVLDAGRREPAILLGNGAAMAAGVRAGMRVNAALALVPDLEIERRRPEREQAALAGLAAWMMRFTPWVSVDPGGDALLLEVAGSLALFGGASALLSAAVAGAAGQGHEALAAMAPTARAALWLARAGQGQVVTDAARLPAVLAGLPASLPGWPARVVEGLQRMGLRQLGDCMRLPRDGFRRRLGGDCQREIDEALGRRPELRPPCRPAGHFHEELEMPLETGDLGLLLQALRGLLPGLAAWLRLRQAAVQLLWLRFHHAAGGESLLRIGLARPTTDMAQVQELAALHFSRLQLGAAVRSLSMTAIAAAGSPGMAEALPGMERATDGSEWDGRLAGLLERLRLRLGSDAVHGLRAVAEHRPERAWQAVGEVAGPGLPAIGGVSRGPRPLWLLARPVPLAERGGMPWLRGPLVLDDGPERIEAGWWDGDDIRRDYHLAHDARGLRMWVYQERRSRHWYLHGLFG